METIQVKDKCFELYIPDGEIQRRVAEVAARIKADMAGERPLLVGILTGAYMFAADLSRALDGEYEMTFARYSSYAGMSSTGQLAEVMPMTWPYSLNRGPPELPELMAVSVCSMFMTVPSLMVTERSLAET